MDNLEAEAQQAFAGADSVFCCLGTTRAVRAVTGRRPPAVAVAAFAVAGEDVAGAHTHPTHCWACFGPPCSAPQAPVSLPGPNRCLHILCPSTGSRHRRPVPQGRSGVRGGDGAGRQGCGGAHLCAGVIAGRAAERVGYRPQAAARAAVHEDKGAGGAGRAAGAPGRPHACLPSCLPLSGPDHTGRACRRCWEGMPPACLLACICRTSTASASLTCWARPHARRPRRLSSRWG